jgi:signal transduction protein with GAF and PtsI domain
MMSEETGNNDNLEKMFRKLLRAIEASGRAILPSSNLDLLQSIVEAAARIFGAAAASIALLDTEAGELEFKVSYGAGNEKVIGRRIPLDEGIAGYVTMTGQPIAISDVRQDARFHQDFAESTGYVPQSILATPLLWEDRVIGVMSVLDKIDSSSFNMEDMDLLGLFAHQASIAIFQSQQYDRINDALLRGIKAIMERDRSGEVADASFGFLTELERDESGEDLLQLAELFNSISGLGESERRACFQILKAFGDYANAQPRFI